MLMGFRVVIWECPLQQTQELQTQTLVMLSQGKWILTAFAKLEQVPLYILQTAV